MNFSDKNILHTKTENQEFLQFKKLLKYSSLITHCYSVGLNKNYRTFKANREELSKEDYEKNINYYKTLCDANNLNYKNIIKANQNHTDKILSIKNSEDIIKKENSIDTKIEYDGIITNQKNIILATTNADCILLLFFDPVKKVIANTHSGWKGTLQEIAVKTVNQMQSDFGCNPKDIIVCICPSIRKCHFEVDEEVYKMFKNKFGYLNNIIVNNKDKWNIDTVLINKEILKKAGILEENIEDCEICSVCNKDYIHSYRAEGKNYGLATAIISLK